MSPGYNNVPAELGQMTPDPHSGSLKAKVVLQRLQASLRKGKGWMLNRPGLQTYLLQASGAAV